MTNERLKLAGYLSIVSAIITIPLTVVSVIVAFQPGTGPEIILVLLQCIVTIMAIYILLSLMGLLNSRFGFHDVDTPIAILIWTNIFVVVFSSVPLLFPESETILGLLLIVFIMLYGIVSIVFAVRLLRLKDDLYGLLKPFAYLIIALGVFHILFFLIPLAMILSVIADIVLARIFFRAVAQQASKLASEKA